MPEFLQPALAQPGLVWLTLAVFVAGCVRGFTGFGTAMVYMPVAAQFLNPFAALTTLTLIDVIGPLPNIPRAFRQAHRRDILRLCLGLLVALPAGVLVLSLVAPFVFRYAVSMVTLVLLILLVAGVRYHGALRHWMIYGVGMLGGFLAGSTGLAGPPVIMLYMASRHAAKVVRANLMLYLFLVDILMLATLWVMGRLDPGAIVLGFCLAVPYLVGNVVGALLFRPDLEKLYRAVAYIVIAGSAVSGLPLLD